VATLLSNWIGLARGHLQGTSRDEINVLGASIAAAGTLTATFTAPLGGIVKGALLSIDLEVIQVTSTASPTVAIVRGLHGSTATTHANAAPVLVNPRFTDFAILQALNDELASLSSPANGLYQILTADVAATTASSYTLALTNFVDILDVRYQDFNASSAYWPRIRRYTVERDANATSFPGGVNFILYEPAPVGRTMHIRYKGEFTALPAVASTDVTTTGLPTTAWDIPPIGAAARLLMGRESRRSSADAAPESRQATEVPPGTARSAAQGLMVLRNQRIKEEAARLRARHPAVRRSA
jgi:hypothetical protein